MGYARTFFWGVESFRSARVRPSFLLFKRWGVCARVYSLLAGEGCGIFPWLRDSIYFRGIGLIFSVVWCRLSFFFLLILAEVEKQTQSHRAIFVHEFVCFFQRRRFAAYHWR